jgi:hypothetical protein
MLQSCADCGTCIATACGTCNKGRMGGSRRSKDAEIRLLGCLIHPLSENCGPTCRRMAASVFACASFDCSESLSAFPASPLTRSAPRHAHPRCDAHAAGPSLPLSCTVETCIARDDATAATLNAREDNVPWAAPAGTSRARRIPTTRGVYTFHEFVESCGSLGSESQPRRGSAGLGRRGSLAGKGCNEPLSARFGCRRVFFPLYAPRRRASTPL